MLLGAKHSDPTSVKTLISPRSTPKKGQKHPFTNDCLDPVRYAWEEKVEFSQVQWVDAQHNWLVKY